MIEPAAVILRAEPKGAPLVLDAGELALLDTSRCGRCCHLAGLHVTHYDDYGDSYQSCAVCDCDMEPFGPLPKPHPFASPRLHFRFMGSVAA